MKGTFSLDPKKLIAGKYFGQFQSIFAGIGTEASDIRQYTPGDSAKTINRKTSAKQQQLYSNVYHQEKSIAIDIFRDVNYNWNGKMQDKKNYERVRECMSDIIVYAKKYGATLTIFYNEAKGLVFKHTSLQTSVINKQYDSAVKLMLQLGPLASKSSKRYCSQLSTFTQQMMQNKKRRAIVVFSDFLGINEQESKQLQHLKQDHVVILFQLPVSVTLGQNYDGTMIKEGKNIGLEFQRLL